MYIDKICIFGAGGHAKVVLDALDSSDNFADRVVVTDADPAKTGTSIAGRCVAEWPNIATLAGAAVHVAIGSNQARSRTHRMLTKVGARAFTVIHPYASISTRAIIADGVFIAAQAVIGPEAELSEGVIVNHGAVVDHDCVVGAFSHVAPNATLGGGVSIGTNVLIGSGATILPGVRIGNRAIISAGATITRDVAPGEKVIFALIRKVGK